MARRARLRLTITIRYTTSTASSPAIVPISLFAHTSYAWRSKYHPAPSDRQLPTAPEPRRPHMQTFEQPNLSNLSCGGTPTSDDGPGQGSCADLLRLGGRSAVLSRFVATFNSAYPQWHQTAQWQQWQQWRQGSPVRGDTGP